MAKAILVPIDFTPVSLNALSWACALRTENVRRIIAVHLLDPKIAGSGMADASLHNPAFQKIFKHMQQEIIEKTEEDLQNFVQQLQREDTIITPLVTFGTIYESFAEIADNESAVLTVMGTHGIVGMQHLTGSRAYKAVVQAERPFLVVQTKPYSPPERWYLVFSDKAQLQSTAITLLSLAECLPGEFIVNINRGAVDLPNLLEPLAKRIKLVSESLSEDHNILQQAALHGATAVGYCIDESENTDASIYGLSQSRIMANDAEVPVLCLTAA